MANELTTTILAAIVDEIIAETERRLNQNVGLMQTMRHVDLLGQPAVSAVFSEYNRISGSQITALAEGTELTTNIRRTLTAKTASLQEYPIAATITQMSATSTREDVVATIVDQFVNALGAGLEKSITDLYSGFSGFASASNTGDLTLDQFSLAKNTLRKAHAPMDQIVAVLHPDQWEGNKGVQNALQDENVAAGTEFGVQFLAMGGVGMIQGIPVFVSNEVSTGGNNVATGSVYIAKHALGLVTKGLADVQFQPEIRKRGTDIVATGRWGTVELIDEWGLKLTSDVS